MSDDDLDLQLSLRKRNRAPRAPPAPKTDDDRDGGDERDHTYMELLERAYAIHRERHPLDHEALRVPHARVGRMGGKRTVVLNFAEICQRMRRTADLQAYIAAETQADTSVDGRGGLVLRGRFTGNQMDALVRAYASAYVICKSCRSGKTCLFNESRLRFIVCEECGGRHCVG